MRFIFLVALFCSLILARPCRADDDLRILETDHYRIHTDLDDDLVKDLGRRMDIMYEEYSRRLATFAPADASTRYEVYLTRTQERYLHFAGLALAGTGGSYNPQRKILAAFLDGQGRDGLRRTLQHEAFHQFAAATIGPKLPIWLNEGLAQVFEEAVYAGDGFILGQVPPRRVRQLQSDISQHRLIDFEHMLSMPPLEWASHWRDTGAAATEYNQAWAMTHFLIYATDENGGPKYRDRLIQMLHEIRDGQDGLSAFRAAFSDNIPGFQARFEEFAADLQPTPQAALIDNQGVLADMLIQMKDRGETFSSLEDFRTACITQRWRIRYSRAGITWESAPDPMVYFTASDGRFYPRDEQYFENSADSDIPDLVCHPDGLINLRTHFADDDGKLDHETVADTN